MATRLTLYYGVSFLVLLVLFAGFALISVHLNQQARLQQRLSGELSQLFGEVLVGATRPGFNPALTQRTGSYLVGGSDGLYVRLLSPQGQVLDQSPNFAGQAAVAPTLPSSTSGITETDATWDAQPVRSLYAPVFVDSVTVSGWIEVSGYRWEIRQALLEARWRLGLGLLLAVILALAAGYGLARRALKPVALITTSINQIGATDLSVRLPPDRHVHDELTDLATTFNALLARLEASFQRERRFTANAAHQLLNPLANMRNEAEVTLRHVREVSTYEHTLRTMLANIKRMSLTVERLLQLAKAEAIAPSPHERVDLSALCTTQVQYAEPLLTEHNVHLVPSIDPGIYIEADTGHIQEVIANLLDNAIKYTRPGDSVTVALKRAGNAAHLTVSDTGVGFNPAEQTQLFERFFRSNLPEVQAQPGSGLGLAIVQTIVERYGGAITAHSQGHYTGSTFTVSFPVHGTS